MAEDRKIFSGRMNSDDKPENLSPVEHIDALNIRFYGGQDGLTAENVKGNYVINNTNLPGGSNDNECIGSFYDTVKNRIIWFNYNSTGLHGIYQLEIQTGLITQIFRCGVNSATDILNFSLNYPVHSSAIVYRTEGDGDLLYWTDGLNRPRCLNLDTVSSLSPFTDGMLNAAKNSPLTPPVVTYQSDTTFTANNLRKKLFRFIYRWVYKNGEKSTWSPISKVSFSENNYDPDIQNDVTDNNRLDIIVYGGGNDYKSVEIAGQYNILNTWSDFFLIDKLDGDEYLISPDNPYTFHFYNDGAYITIDPIETDLYFSWLPDKANTLELLNGNVLIYSGVTEGYDQLQRSDIDVTITCGLSAPNVPSISAAMAGANVFTLIIGSIITTGVTYTVFFDYNSGAGGDASPKNVSYVTLIGDTPLSVALAIKALIEGNNIQADSLGSGVLRILTSTGLGTITNLAVSASSSGVEVAAESYKWDCPGRLGILYFDDRGKTNGVVSFISDSAIDTTDFGFTTPSFDVVSGIPQVPIVSASINHIPPLWAKSYQWVRCNLLPTNFLYWVSNGYQSDTDYLYICIQNLTYTKSKNNGFIPSYEFLPGDRVRVMASYAGSTFTPYNIQLDCEIIGTVTRTMTSPASDGLFLKIAKPSTLPSSPYQAEMLIEIYTPKQRVADELQLFYEWGEKFDIYESGGSKILDYALLGGAFQIGEVVTQSFGGGGIGTVTSASPTQLTVTVISGTFGGGYTIIGGTSGATGVVTGVTDGFAFRYHRGQVADQTASQPATFQWFDGDVYYRGRRFYTVVDGTTTASEYFMDANYSDYFNSEVNSNGRGWIINQDGKQEYNGVLSRWGDKYQSGTNINKLNIFKPSDYDEADRAKGDIRRLKVRDRILRVFQDRGVGQYGVYSRFIQNNEGVPELVTTNEIITTNNIQYYQGVYGLGAYPTNLCSTAVADYFSDITTGREVRLSGDGITDLGLLYKGQFALSGYVTPYNKELLRDNGSKAKVIKFWDNFENEAHTILQDGTGGGTTVPAINYAFNETRNGFSGFFSYAPEWALSTGDITYSWKAGQLYKHDVPAPYCNWYGVQYACSITIVFNMILIEKKTWNSITEIASDIWSCPEIRTNVLEYAGQYQETNLVEAEFKNLEQNPTSSIKRSVSSRGGKINGSFMKGNWCIIKFQKTNAASLLTLSSIICRFTDSPLNIR